MTLLCLAMYRRYGQPARLLAPLVALALLLGLSNAASAACPEFLDQEFRKLHSKDSVNLCAVSDGKPLLVINTASHCGYTKQFEGLEALADCRHDVSLRQATKA